MKIALIIDYNILNTNNVSNANVVYKYRAEKIQCLKYCHQQYSEISNYLKWYFGYPKYSLNKIIKCHVG